MHICWGPVRSKVAVDKISVDIKVIGRLGRLHLSVHRTVDDYQTVFSVIYNRPLTWSAAVIGVINDDSKHQFGLSPFPKCIMSSGSGLC